MATYYNHAQIGIVDSSGNVNVIYPKTEGSDVSVTPNSNYSAGDTVQKVISNLGSAAFKNVSEFSTSSHNHDGKYVKIAGSGDIILHWDGSINSTSWLCGWENGNSIRCISPSKLSVNYANSANSASKCSHGSFGSMAVHNIEEYMSTYGANRIFSITGMYGMGKRYLHVNINGWGAYGVDMWASDTKLKNNIKHTNETHALEKINQIEMIQFNWNDDNEFVPLGISANQLETVIPSAVYDVDQSNADNNYDNLKNISGNELTTYLIKAVQELTDIVNEQKKEIEKLKRINNI